MTRYRDIALSHHSRFADSQSSDYNAGTVQPYSELGYRIDTPHAAFAALRQPRLCQSEHGQLHGRGSAAALASHGETTDTTFTTLGLRSSSDFTLGTINATARGMLGCRHAYGDIIPTSTHAFSAGDAFTVAGVPIAKDSALIEAGIDLNLTDAATWPSPIRASSAPASSRTASTHNSR